MRTYTEAETYSKKNPTELVEFKDLYPDRCEHWTGFLLNGKRDGLFEYYRGDILLYNDVYNSITLHSEHKWFTCDGSLELHYFRKNKVTHGEYKSFNEDGAVVDQYFYNSGTYVKELDYLVHEERDEAFYFTLSMHGIDKEYTL